MSIILFILAPLIESLVISFIINKVKNENKTLILTILIFLTFYFLRVVVNIDPASFYLLLYIMIFLEMATLKIKVHQFDFLYVIFLNFICILLSFIGIFISIITNFKLFGFIIYLLLVLTSMLFHREFNIIYIKIEEKWNTSLTTRGIIILFYIVFIIFSVLSAFYLKL